MFELATLLAAFVPACNFSLALGPDFSPETGQHPVGFTLVNRGPRTCRLHGYPKVVLEDRAGPIPFVIRHRGTPATVTVRPHRAAYVLLSNYRCDRGARRAATLVRIDRSSLRLTNPYRRPNWCGKGDPGSVLTVFPYESTLHG